MMVNPACEVTRAGLSMLTDYIRNGHVHEGQ